VVDGAGDNVLVGGFGPSILIGGAGHADIQGGAGAALQIAGTTEFDANQEALRALEAEWSRTDESYGTKVGHIEGGGTGSLNGTYVFNGTTVQSQGGQDSLTHSTGSGMDLFFAHLFGDHTDTIYGLLTGEIVTEI
jgi:hypothetical protein